MRVNFKCSYFHTPRTNFAATLKNPSYQLGTNKQLNNFVHFIIPVYKLFFFYRYRYYLKIVVIVSKLLHFLQA